MSLLAYKMPSLSPTMTKGVVARWHKNVGDPIKKGDLLLEIETDKAVMEVESDSAGFLTHKLCDDGASAQVDDVIAYIGRQEDVGCALSDVSAVNVPSQDLESSSAHHASEMNDVDRLLHTSSSSPCDMSRLKISPLARKFSRAHALDDFLGSVQASGPGGRIVLRDVEKFLKERQKTSSSVSSPEVESEQKSTNHDEKPATNDVFQSSPPLANVHTQDECVPSGYTLSVTEDLATCAYEDHHLSGMQRVVADRLKESKQAIPHFYTERMLSMEGLQNLYQKLKDDNEAISFNSLMMFVIGRALARHQSLNGCMISDHTVRLFKQVDLAFAVSVEGGLVTPVVRGIDRLSLAGVHQACQDLIEKARSKRLRVEDYEGGGCTVSNMGMLGVDRFVPIINPPQVMIVGLSRMIRRPVWDDASQSFIPTLSMSVMLSADHRWVNGHDAASFLQTLHKYTHNPYTML